MSDNDQLLQELDEKLKWLEFETEHEKRIATMKKNDNIIKKMTYDFMNKERKR